MSRLVILFLLLAPALFAASPAADLMKRGLFKDAIRLLGQEIQGKPERDNAIAFLRLGECHYNLKQYAASRPWFAKAQRQIASGPNRSLIDYRLGCLAYRLNDGDALALTDAFVARNGNDRRAGTLLVFKMRALAARGPTTQSELEATRQRIADNKSRYGSTNDLAADKILTDFYLEHDQADAAEARYKAIVFNYPKVAAQYKEAGRGVPDAVERARDNAAMQLATIALRSERHSEAIKWLENVRFDETLRHKARLMHAQIAYQQRDFDTAKSLLLKNDYIRTVGPGPVRDDMYLLLGFCEKNARKPTLAAVLDMFTKIDPSSPAYGQGMMGLADSYEKWRRWDDAIGCFEKALRFAKYEPEALLKLGKLYIQKGTDEEDLEKAQAAYLVAADRLTALVTKYPQSPHCIAAEPSIEALIAKGYSVARATTDAESLAQFETVVRERPGSAEAARALLAIAKIQRKTILDEKGENYLRAPNFPACVDACRRLLNPQSYSGKDLAERFWQDMRAAAFYYRADAQVASTQGSDYGGKTPSFLPEPDLDAALADFARAQELVAVEEVSLVKGIELGTLEAQFLSPDEDLRAQARERFDTLAVKYGEDAQFQKLAMDLAHYYHRQGQYRDAAREYRAIAQRAAKLAPDDIVNLLLTAGKLYSKAAYDSRHDESERRYGIYISPKALFASASLLDSHEPLKTRITPAFSKGASVADALRSISQASGVPFTWRGKLHMPVPELPAAGTLADYLRALLPEHHNLAFDIGLSGPPSIAPDPDPDDPSAIETARVIEILDSREAHNRYKPLTKPYGKFQPGMMFTILEHIERESKTDIFWAEGVNKDDVLAAEFASIPNQADSKNLSLAQVLEALLHPLELRYEIIARDLADELYAEAKDCFNDIRQLAPKNASGESALFLLALNYYQQQDYERMRIVLREYLKVFDSPSFAHYHEACFWVGWVFEHDKKYRDAARYYNMAAAEKLRVVEIPKYPNTQVPKAAGSAGGPPASPLAYDTKFALDETVTGAIVDKSLAEFLDFVRLNTGVAVDADAAVMDREVRISRPAESRTVLALLEDVLAEHQLSYRCENRAPGTAERAYYRLAVCYQRDGLLDQALASTQVLLDRYPATNRRRAARKLQLDIHKALKNYRDVLATLESLKAESADAIERYKIDFEIAWIYADLCRYTESIEHFKQSLAAATDEDERLRIRDGYARALFAANRKPEALTQYKLLAKAETQPLRAFIAEQLVWYLQAEDASIPAGPATLVTQYEALSDPQRQRLSRNDLAKVTWIYYLAGRLQQGDAAIDKFEAAGNSPDDWLAAEALLRVGELHQSAQRWKQARETYEHLLFTTRSPQAELKAIFGLAKCHDALGATDKARARYQQILDKYADSAFANSARTALDGGADHAEDPP
jgi:tetratricopeptide (TPR) repeat protein